MSDWNFDISQAPRGHTVDDFVQTAKGVRKTTRFLPEKLIVATKCGKVTVSKYLPDEDRWEMLAKEEQPIAWQLWPTHPDFEQVFSSLPTPAATPTDSANPPPVESVGPNSEAHS
jgi:hypothetical protein